MNKEQILDTRIKLTEFITQLQKTYYKPEDIEELLELRHYKGTPYEDKYRKLFNELKIFKMPIEMLSKLFLTKYTLQEQKEMGLENVRMLEGRFMIPIRDLVGNIVTVTSWSATSNVKYITLPTLGFSKRLQYFNEECLDLERPVYVVEGVFDVLTLRMLGKQVLGAIGLDLSLVKEEKLKKYKKVICITDNDTQGHKTNPYIEKNEKNWKIPVENLFIGLPDGIKDADDLCKSYAEVDKVLDTLEKEVGFIQL